MPSEIVMPKFSDRMTGGSIVSWVKGTGDRVEPGDILAILASEGGETGLPAFVPGVLREILVGPGTSVPVGTVIARLELCRDESQDAGQQVRDEATDPDHSSRIRQLCDAWRSAPHCAVTVHIDMEAVENLCQSFREDGVRITANDFIIRACVAALSKFPQVNSSLAGDEAVRHRSINIGMVLSLKRGAATPVLKECGRKSLRELARESRLLMEQARKGKLSPHETMGGTFTVANLGMYGIDEYQTVVRSGEAAVLALGAIRNAPLVTNGRVVPGRVMTATLCADHRLLDGADAGLFMAELRRLLEHPEPLLITGTP